MVDIVYNRRKWCDRREADRRSNTQEVGCKNNRSGSDRRIGNKRRKHIYSFIKNNCAQYEESLKWEFSLLSEIIKNTQRKKLMIIGSSMALLSVILTLLLSFYSLRYNVDENSKNTFMLGLFTILMGLGIINFGAITYVAALKSTEILYKRQLTCLRQALDAVKFYLLEGVFPRNRDKIRDIIYLNEKDDFDNENSNYWKIFGNHRKLPIDNFGFRRHMESWFESSDKMFIGIQFLIAEASVLLPVGLYFVSPSHIDIDGMGILSIISVIVGAVGILIFVDSIRRISKATACLSNKPNNSVITQEPEF